LGREKGVIVSADAFGQKPHDGHLGLAPREASWQRKAPQVLPKAVPFVRVAGRGPWLVRPASEVPDFEEDEPATVGCPGKPELASVPPRAC
jgi:hypothetical protein